METERGDAPTTTPAGETGVQDIRDEQERHGKGRVADAAAHSPEVEESYRYGKPLDDDPTGDDPHGVLPESGRTERMHGDPGPTYERGQGTEKASHGGSVDPNNTLTHANSGDETEMADQVDNQNRSHETVDGFSDTEGKTNVDSPDPGENKKADPMSPQEYAEAQKEARTEDDDK